MDYISVNIEKYYNDLEYYNNCIRKSSVYGVWNLESAFDSTWPIYSMVFFIRRWWRWRWC
jgi:hypothetical protein